MRHGFPVSIAELLAAGERPVPSEAVAIVLDVCRQVMQQHAGRSVPPAITPGALFVDGSGAVSVAGGVPVEDDQTVQMLGRLLLQMLPGGSSSGARRVPRRLVQLATRAASADAPRLSVDRLAAGLRRFGPEHPETAVRALFERWQTGRARAAAANSAGGAPRTTARASSVAAGESPEPLPAASHDAGRFWSPRRTRRLAVGAAIASLLVLAGLGATVWLDANVNLPPVPLNPAILMSQPPQPARGGWELLSDRSDLAVELRAPGASPDAPAGLDEHPQPAGTGRGSDSPVEPVPKSARPHGDSQQP